jgi:predicted nucleic acid-binding protein
MKQRTPHNTYSDKLILFISEARLNGFITASSVTDIYYLLKKHFHDTNRSKQELLKLFTLFEIIDVTKSDCEKAFNLSMDDYEDALLATCAKRKKLDFIITRNLKDFFGSPIQAIAPDDFLANYF